MVAGSSVRSVTQTAGRLNRAEAREPESRETEAGLGVWKESARHETVRAIAAKNQPEFLKDPARIAE
jgi:hypothetical protein